MIILYYVSLSHLWVNPMRLSPGVQYNMVGIKLPSGNYGQTPSQGGFKRILYSMDQKEKEPKM